MNGEARKLGWFGIPADYEEWQYLFGCHMATGFQTQVNVQPAPAVEGDFAAFNYNRSTVLAGPGGLVSGPNGCTVGRFAWISGVADPDGTPTSVSTSFTGVSVIVGGGTLPYGTNAQMPFGFIHREQQALITAFLADATLVVPQGFPVTVFREGDFWVKNRGTTTAQIGHKAYASFADGSVSFAASGATATGASITATIFPALATITASIAGNVLSVTALASGTLTPGMTLSGSGGGTTVLTGTTITAQLSGSAGAVGTYSVNLPEQTVGSITMNGSVGLLNVSAVASGTLTVGQTVTGTGVALGTLITASNVSNPGLGLTGAGATGTYYVNPSQSDSSSADTTSGGIETKFFAMSNGLVGELVKISSSPIG